VTETLLALVPEQAEAKRLLAAALAERSAHAYLLHGPPGVGAVELARAFAAELLGGDERALRERPTHPDLYLLEPLGEMIRIDDIRALRHDLHLRPFESDRRVYLILEAHLLNEDAADALLKDLEEPPDYATIVLVADELGSLPETILSRCQLVPCRRLSDGAVLEWMATHAPELDQATRAAIARSAAGRLDRARRLLEPAAAERRRALVMLARETYRRDDFDAAAASAFVLDAIKEAGAAARLDEEGEVERRGLVGREAEQRLRRAQRGAERRELLAALDTLSTWYRDLAVVAAGAGDALLNADFRTDLEADGADQAAESAATAAALVRQTWLDAEEFNVNTGLALEALFVRVRRALT
jgi:DNA polymerase III subunit delta'